MAASDAAAMPLPRDDTTPPVTKTYLVMTGPCSGDAAGPKWPNADTTCVAGLNTLGKQQDTRGSPVPANAESSHQDGITRYQMRAPGSTKYFSLSAPGRARSA